MCCQYQVWNAEAEPPNMQTGMIIYKGSVVEAGNLEACGHGDGNTHLCAEHCAFVADAEERGIITNRNGNTTLIHPKAIKELFPKQKRQRKPKICPHCGREI